MKLFSVSIAVLLGSFTTVKAYEQICTSDTNVFTVTVNLFASELGYYTIEECGDMPNPTIGMEVGQTYTFIQNDRGNFYHPLGFAYLPDGGPTRADELEPGNSMGSSGCETTMTCPAPMYFVGGSYQGTYSNIPEVLPVTQGESNFGLDDYEPIFFYPIAEWASSGPYSIQLRFDDATYDQDLFYFCHIHRFMSGRIKLLNSGVPVSEPDVPALGYEYDMPTGFDAECGTFLLNDFQLPNPQCPDRFVCDADSAGEDYAKFASCIDAMDCHMMAGMTTGSSAGSEVALFIHQMIPHHQNAVNMAKALLKTNKLNCPDITVQFSPDCIMESILREIVNGQNFQIQLMRAVANFNGYPQEDDCIVPIKTGKLSKKSDNMRGKAMGKKIKGGTSKDGY